VTLTERTAGQLWDQILRRRISIGIRLYTFSERIHSRLLVAPILRIELIFAKDLDWIIDISFGRLAVERSAMDLLLESLQMPYLAFLSRGKGFGLLDIGAGRMLLHNH